MGRNKQIRKSLESKLRKVTIFFIPPLIFVLLLVIDISYNKEINLDKVEFSSDFNEFGGYMSLPRDAGKNVSVTYNSSISGRINLTRHVDLKVEQITFLIGDWVNLPIIRICFHNNGTSDDKISNFDSDVIINNEKLLNIPYKQFNCFVPETNEEIIYFSWVTTFDYTQSSFKYIDEKGMMVSGMFTKPVYSDDYISKNYYNYKNIVFILIMSFISYWLFIYNLPGFYKFIKKQFKSIFS